MTEKLWTYINGKNMKLSSRMRLFVFIRTVICLCIGLILWLVLHHTVALPPDWGLCIVLLMVLIGYAGGIYYLFKKY